MKHLLRSIVVALFLYAQQAGGQIISTYAGGGPSGYFDDGYWATHASLNGPWGVGLDSVGNLIVADYFRNMIRKVDTSWHMYTVIGWGLAGFAGDGGPASAARIQNPWALTVDKKRGDTYFADVNGRIRKINAAGIISTVAGTGVIGVSGDGGPATAATIGACSDIAVDAAGNVFFADDSRIRKITPAGIITTVAGTGVGGYSGDGAPATATTFSTPFGIALDTAGNMYLTADERVRKIDAAGIVSTIAGNDTGTLLYDGMMATDARLLGPSAIETDDSGRVFFVDNHSRIWKLSATGRAIWYAGAFAGYSGDGGPAINADFGSARGMVFDAIGTLYFSDYNNDVIRKINVLPAVEVRNDIAGGGRTCTGSFVTFSAYSKGVLHPHYQWRKNGVAAGTDSSYYTTAVANGDTVYCYLLTDTSTVPVATSNKMRVNADLPVTAPIYAGADSVCISAGMVLHHATPGGVWSNTNVSVATMSTNGTVWGAAPGTDTVKYTVTNVCGTFVITYALRVVNCVTETASVPQPDAVAVYPNPTAEMVYVVAPGNCSIAVTDIYGRQVASASGVKQVSLRGLVSGTYLVQVRGSDGRLLKTARIVKQ